MPSENATIKALEKQVADMKVRLDTARRTYTECLAILRGGHLPETPDEDPLRQLCRRTLEKSRLAVLDEDEEKFKRAVVHCAKKAVFWAAAVDLDSLLGNGDPEAEAEFKDWFGRLCKLLGQDEEP